MHQLLQKLQNLFHTLLLDSSRTAPTVVIEFTVDAYDDNALLEQKLSELGHWTSELSSASYRKYTLKLQTPFQQHPDQLDLFGA